MNDEGSLECHRLHPSKHSYFIRSSSFRHTSFLLPMPAFPAGVP